MVEYGTPGMEASPKQQYLQFVLARAEQLFTLMITDKATDSQVGFGITMLISFIPDRVVRQALYSSFFANKKTLGTKTAALLACGETVSAIALSLDIVEQSVGGVS